MGSFKKTFYLRECLFTVGVVELFCIQRDGPQMHVALCKPEANKEVLTV